MKKITFLLCALIIVFAGLIPGKKLVTFTEVMKPDGISLDENQIYITENTSVYIYSLKDFKLKKKFGSAGEGPGEFKDFAVVMPQPDQLLINSTGKISYFKKDGTFIKEKKVGAGLGSGILFPLKEGYVGRGVAIENNTIYVTINFFDANLKKGAELYRMKSPLQQTGKIELLKQSFIFRTYDNKIFVAGKEGFIIDVLDYTGKPLFTINQKYEKRKFTDSDEKIMRDFLKEKYKDRFAFIKDRISLPAYFPEIQYFTVTDDLIYVVSWKIDKKKVEFFIFDIKGKLVKTLFIPVEFENAIYFYPFAIKKGTLYQLIDNEKEEWELHANAIK
jgi:hypothetical protein